MSTTTYFLATLFGGFFGLHKFLSGKKWMGILYLCTFGLFGIAWIYDIITVARDIIKYRQSAQEIKSEGSKIIFDKTFLIVGTTYECRKNPKKQRFSVIQQTQCSTPVHIEKYYYDGEPAYMIVNSKDNLDLGVLSAGAASWLTDNISKGRATARLIDRYNDSFHVRITVIQD